MAPGAVGLLLQEHMCCGWHPALMPHMILGEAIMSENTTTYRWIMYLAQNMPGNQSFDLSRATSLEDAREQYRAYCEAVYSDDCHVTLYAYSDDAWASAEDFRDTGCPFDYPDRIIERGPMGGVVVNNT